MNTQGFLQKPQNWAYIFMGPFAILTLIFLFSGRFLAETVIFVMLAYSAILSSFAGGSLWGVQLLEFNNQPATDEKTISKALLAAIAPMLLTWVSLAFYKHLAIGVILVILVQAWQLFELSQFKAQNRLPQIVASLKVHPLMASLGCLVLALLKLFFACPAA